MSKILLIGCGKAKTATFYTGSIFKKRREYAEVTTTREDNMPTIAAKDVKPGMHIWNSLASRLPKGPSREAYQWLCVREVKHRDDGQVEIHTMAWYTVRHPREGVSVRD